ncbi:30S ribosomal protein S17 [Patescibacteria group bacterium]|nr:30S ribosomal protein S17 [Patescibacteria group bacterium]MBU1684181.1 30S ribosomal protein S17 [Patescibacteria group bacterium]MBU1987283.1 30S ribosomal protein S17 [Patescibacteria group bacterium]MBU2456643.1 30S ribosomal protein S17 [Patescibacteria group bacterium]MBU2474532.1 30S ribosomal protein S17 [Patescibacteria group bacterium]
MQSNITKTEKEINNKKIAIKKKFDGIVISDKMDKTIVVRVDRVKIHPKYKKRYTVSKKYKVHDEKNQFKEGDKVVFIECRPLSKDKRWHVVKSS